jgi:NAD-dependent DNA ligase
MEWEKTLMTDFFTRKAIAEKNDLHRSISSLIGISQGLICDGNLTDEEISFLKKWIENNENMQSFWPGKLIYTKIHESLNDGVVSNEEREHLIDVMQKLVGGTLDKLPEQNLVTDLVFDQELIVFNGKRFCLTGEFVFAPRNHCELAISRRGGELSSGVTKKTDYVVVGSQGSREWRHGSFGTKIQSAMQLKEKGHKIKIVREDDWADALSKNPAP